MGKALIIIQTKFVCIIIIIINSLNQFFKEMYGDQSGEFVFGYWGLKGYCLQRSTAKPPTVHVHVAVNFKT